MTDAPDPLRQARQPVSSMAGPYGHLAAATVVLVLIAAIGA